MNDVSIIIPAYNAEATLKECLQSVTSLDWSNEIEVILVNDSSTDRTAEIAAAFPDVKVFHIPHSGAARATNTGIKTARFDIIALVDADAVLEKDWLQKIVPVLNDPQVAAVGGCPITANKTIIGKIAGYDVELRLARAPADIDHISTTNAIYRRQILFDIGLLSEDMKAGYDVDLSRRLKSAAHKLILNKDARCRHYWKDNIKDYIKQQYNYAYYRMTLTRKFGRTHDQVTVPGMILQVPFAAAVVLFAIFGSLKLSWAPLALLSLPLIHLPETFSLLVKKRDSAVLFMPLLFTLRNLTWLWAAAVWGIHFLTGSVPRAASQPRPGSSRK